MTMTDGKEMRLAGSKMSKRVALMVATTAVLVPAFAFAVETDRLTVEDPSSGAVMFRVTSGGNVTGNAFVGDGAGLTNVPHWKGTWNSATTYNKDETVFFNGGSYIALKQSLAVQPDLDATSWAVFAQKGAAGAQGAQGATGPQGPQGVKGDTGAQGPAGASPWQLSGNNTSYTSGLVSIGAAPTGNSLYVLSNGVTTLNDILGMNQPAGMGFDIKTSTTAPPSGPTQGANAIFLIQNSNGGAGIANNYNSFRYIAQVNGAENYTGTVSAFNLQGKHNGTGNATKIQGAIGSITVMNAGGITNGYALAAGAPGTAGTGIITNAVGLYVNKQKQSFVTNGYGIYQADSADANVFNGNVGIGVVPTSASQKLEVNGGIRVNSAAARPTCDATSRGTFWVTQGAAGVKDAVEVCAKDAADAYAWRQLW